MRMTESDLKNYQDRQKKWTVPANASPELVHAIDKVNKKIDKQHSPNKTESEYGRMLQMEFPGALVKFEPVTFHMENGHRYTPDWVVQIPGCVSLIIVEVKARGKNGFRLPSYQRAKLAFDQCRVDYPQFTWRWAEKSSGTWAEHTYGND